MPANVAKAAAEVVASAEVAGHVVVAIFEVDVADVVVVEVDSEEDEVIVS